MGDRYEFDADCAYCGKLNKGVWYAPTCDKDTFTCEYCRGINFITYDFKIKKLENIRLSDIVNGFLFTTNRNLTREQAKELCKTHFGGLQKNKKVAIEYLKTAKKKVGIAINLLERGAD